VRSRAEIAADIEREQARLAELRERADASTAHLAALREEIGAIPQEQLGIVTEPTAAPSFAPTSNAH
jgi:hypothetical protein